MNVSRPQLRVLIVGLMTLVLYLVFQSTSIYGGDAGDLVSAAYTRGIAHPPGYPLYSFIGYILTLLPLETVAWRVALISSFSAAGAIAVLYWLNAHIVESRKIAFTAALTVGLSGTMWLYASVPEVFALHVLLTALLVSTAYSYSLSPSTHKLYALSFMTGLALTHHHTIIFSLPAVALLLMQQRSHLLGLRASGWSRTIMFGAIGLTPYIWVYIAALGNPPILWDDPINLHNFVRLITRADYGTFQSGILYGQSVQARLLQFPILGTLYIRDLTLLGASLAVVGGVYGLRQKPQIAAPLTVGFLFTGPLYFFYASYLITNSFHIATAERFMLASYVYISPLIALGIHASIQALMILGQRIVPNAHHVLASGALVMCMLLPLGLMYGNASKIASLTHDRTAEHFGEDILTTPEENSILLLQGDHPVFNTQYMYYANGLRTDIHIIHLTKFLNGTSDRQLRAHYPSLRIPLTHDPIDRLGQFIDANFDKASIYSSVPLELIPEGYQWVPVGLLFRLYRSGEVPDYAAVNLAHQRAWAKYHDPLSGSLKDFTHLMLSSVLEYYADAHVRHGLYAAAVGEDHETALASYNEALRLDPERGAIYYLMAASYMHVGACDEAVASADKGVLARPNSPGEYYRALADIYRLCYLDEVSANEWQKKLDDLSEQEETPLESL